MNPTQFLACLLAVVLPLSGNAREIHRVWSYAESRDEADLVVIATPISVKETPERTALPHIRIQFENGKTGDVMGTGIETTFEVEAVLKGDAKLKKFVLHHYDSEPAMDGPMLVKFEPERGNYLMFLKREADGRYCPLSGQTDPWLTIHKLEPKPMKPVGGVKILKKKKE